MNTWNVELKERRSELRELSSDELFVVSGGGAPALAFLGVGIALGAGEGAASAHANGKSVTGGALIGAVTGIIGGAAGAVWKVSRTAGIVLAGVASSFRAASSYAGNRITVFQR